MHRAETEVRTPESLPGSRLYIHDPSVFRGDSLSSVSYSSSTRDLTMQSLSSHSSDDGLSVHPTNTIQRPPPPQESKPTKHVQSKALHNDPTADELQYIKDSVERLRVQRMHVEHLRQRSERLEHLLADRAKETDKLRLQVASLRGVEQENLGLLKSFQLLEERIRTLEATCNDRKDEARTAIERLAMVEKARDTLQLRVDELAVEREHFRKQLGGVQMAHEKRIEEVKTTHERVVEKLRRGESEWQNKLQDLVHTQSHVERKLHDQLAHVQRENLELERQNRAMEQHVQQLLATTVRQTTMIEDCDRLLREHKTRYDNAKAKYRNEAERNARLLEQIKQLEIQLSMCEHGFGTEKNALETKVGDLETKVRKFKDKNDMYVVALQEKEKLCEKLQNELLVRDRARSHVEDVVKELRQNEKTHLSEISSLKIALADIGDEKSILQDQIRGLQEQLAKERNDRSRWATARLKLLAEFCDEENKLSTALHPYSMDLLLGDEEGVEEVLGEAFGEGDDDSEVGATVAATGMKMDALDRQIHGRSSARPPVQTRSPPPTGKPIVFG